MAPQAGHFILDRLVEEWAVEDTHQSIFITNPGMMQGK
jgi:hypothetical protein